MADLKTWVPEGFVDGKHPMLSESLMRRLERLGRRAGPQRLVVRLVPGANEADLEGFFVDRPAWGARERLPGLIEVDIMPHDIQLFTERPDLFAWIGVATRLTGKPLQEAGRTALIKISVVEGRAGEVAARVKKLGGTVAGSSNHELLARMPAERVAELLPFEDEVDAIDVAGAE
ncbi:MAG: hypothetical protein KatS3mg102_0949 [Planctomycetota bacterium]|nr:MAG: hypothetical protein KatS3mg102_0949 [Planctomycetota bacterium]